MFSENIYDILSKKMNREGLTAQHVADAVGVNASTVQRWLTVKNVPKQYLGCIQRMKNKTIIEPVDQFFTDFETAKKCHAKFIDVLKALELDPDDYIFVEPSAGDGAFYNLFPDDRRLGFDIAPMTADVEKCDFLKLPRKKFPKDKKYVTLGNPPFGFRGHLALKFINKAAQFSDVVGFILPHLFENDNAAAGAISCRVDKALKLAHIETFNDDGFRLPGGKNTPISVVFMVWSRVNHDLIRDKHRRTCDTYVTIRKVTDGSRHGRDGKWRCRELIGKCDIYLPDSSFENDMKPHTDFYQLPYWNGYGLRFHKDKDKLMKLVEGFDWPSVCKKSTNSALFLRKGIIEDVITNAGFFDEGSGVRSCSTYINVKKITKGGENQNRNLDLIGECDVYIPDSCFEGQVKVVTEWDDLHLPRAYGIQFLRDEEKLMEFAANADWASIAMKGTNGSLNFNTNIVEKAFMDAGFLDEERPLTCDKLLTVKILQYSPHTNSYRNRDLVGKCDLYLAGSCFSDSEMTYYEDFSDVPNQQGFGLLFHERADELMRFAKSHDWTKSAFRSPNGVYHLNGGRIRKSFMEAGFVDPVPSLSDFVEVKMVASSPPFDRPRNEKLISNCDLYIACASFDKAGMRAYETFEELPNSRGFGIILKKNSDLLHEFAFKHDWSKIAFRSPNGAYQLNGDLIRSAFKSTKFVNSLPSLEDFVEVKMVADSPPCDRPRNKDLVGKCDLYIPFPCFKKSDVKAYEKFTDAPANQTFGLIFKRNQDELKQFALNHNWADETSKSPNGAYTINGNKIRKVFRTLNLISLPTAPAASDLVDAKLIIPAGDPKACNTELAGNCDLYLIHTCFKESEVKPYENFDDLPLGRGYGLIFKSNPVELKQFALNCDWKQYAFKSANGAWHLNADKIKKAFSSLKLPDDAEDKPEVTVKYIVNRPDIDFVRGTKWIGKCDYYVAGVNYYKSKLIAHKKFEDLPYLRGYGIIIRSNRERLSEFIENHNWGEAAAPSANGTFQLNKDRVVKELTKAGFQVSKEYGHASTGSA